MYFSTLLLLLLLTFEFMQLQVIPLHTTELIPFDYAYTMVTENFLEKATKRFKITPARKLLINLSAVNLFKRDAVSNNICETEEISGRPSAESDANCRAVCSVNNRSYVQFLNTNIYELKYLFFIDADWIILELNPIDSDTGSCTENKTKKMYECLCKANYQIMVSEEFYNYFLHIVNSNPNLNKDTIKREYFSVLAIFLKFYPQSAVFYLTYLFEKYNLTAPMIQFKPGKRILNFRGQGVPGGVTGMVEDRGQFKDHEGKIFKEVYKLIAGKKCDINVIQSKYYYKLDTTAWCLVILFYVNQLKFYSSNYL